MTKKLKQNAERYVVREGWHPMGSPVGRRGSTVGRICGTKCIFRSARLLCKRWSD